LTPHSCPRVYIPASPFILNGRNDGYLSQFPGPDNASNHLLYLSSLKINLDPVQSQPLASSSFATYTRLGLRYRNKAVVLVILIGWHTTADLPNRHSAPEFVAPASLKIIPNPATSYRHTIAPSYRHYDILLSV
jgi:hypothetical protein